MVINKKVVGATSIEFDNITFKSLLECSSYKKLKDAGLNPSYESETIILWKGFKLNTLIVYAPKKIGPGKYGKELLSQTRTILNMTYTPDFIVIKGKYKIYFDVKGKENDVYPIKKKLFLRILEEREDGWNYVFFEPHSIRQVLQAIQIINTL